MKKRTSDKVLMRAFSKIWAKKGDVDELKNIMIIKTLEIDEILPREARAGFTDMANILMVVAKKKKFEEFLINNWEVEDLKRVYALKEDAKLGFMSKASNYYNGEILSNLFQLFSGYDVIKVTMKNDFPIEIECDDFMVLLAPRVYDGKTAKKEDEINF